MDCRPPRRHLPAAGDGPGRFTLAGLMLAGMTSLAGAALAAGGVSGPPDVRGDACGLALRSRGVLTIPAGTTVEGAPFGGISGLELDASGRRAYLITDDRDPLRPPRVFVGGWTPAAHGPGRLRLQHAVRLGGVSVDAESLRLDVRRGAWLVASEGDPARGLGPSVQKYALDGASRGGVALPPSLQSAHGDGDSGPQPNRSFEGLALEPGAEALWVALEAPLRQDRAALAPAAGAALRFTRLDRRSGRSTQYVYVADAAPARGAAPLADNGVSEILGGIGERRLLVLERAGVGSVEAGFDFSARLYCADFSAATDVSALDRLDGADWVPARKTLLLELSGIVDVRWANFEAMAWGPRRGRGRRALLLATDDNFAAGVPTVLLELEATGPSLR